MAGFGPDFGRFWPVWGRFWLVFGWFWTDLGPESKISVPRGGYTAGSSGIQGRSPRDPENGGPRDRGSGLGK